ncbi:hypothetical protein FGO68_gene17634 [Halteria grandinella]|uniref:Uncharacterized protein n=1 Tax=Halteria grandinella TaxID=5974 RepID=A0A8J8NNT1_HALGN|nr:hypothetical protein FGO68_gene17634 [Halteria grandinella]
MKYRAVSFSSGLLAQHILPATSNLSSPLQQDMRSIKSHPTSCNRHSSLSPFLPFLQTGQNMYFLPQLSSCCEPPFSIAWNFSFSKKIESLTSIVKWTLSTCLLICDLSP